MCHWMIRLKLDVMGGKEVSSLTQSHVHCSINKTENYCIKTMTYEYSDLFEFERNPWSVHLRIVTVLACFVRW